MIGDEAAVAQVSANGHVLMLVAAPPGSTGVRAHIDVTETAQPIPDDQLAAYLQNAGQNGAASITRPQSFATGGATGLYVTYTLGGPGGVQLKEQDMAVNHAGITYNIVLNAPQTDFAAELVALKTVLDAWTWTA